LRCDNDVEKWRSAGAYARGLVGVACGELQVGQEYRLKCRRGSVATCVSLRPLGWAMDTRLNAQRPRGSISRDAKCGENERRRIY